MSKTTPGHSSSSMFDLSGFIESIGLVHGVKELARLVRGVWA